MKLLLQEPQGAVTSAICALASLHYNRIRVAHGLQVPEPGLAHMQAQMFYETAKARLYERMARPREPDAIAALQLLSFSVLSGGTTDWRPMLDYACTWLAQTGLAANDNPKLTLLNMSGAAQVGFKVTMVSNCDERHGNQILIPCFIKSSG